MILTAAIVLMQAVWAQSPQIAGCPVFPETNIWNTPVDHLPIDKNSARYVETIGANLPLVPDFGSGAFQGGPIGIPFVTVPGDQARVPVKFEYDDESDAGPYPVPPDAPIEGGENSRGDRHVLVLDRDNCVLYELFSAYQEADGGWRAGSGAVFDLQANKMRPSGWTSADAAGFAILPGLVRWEEVAAGEIRHAIRMTVPQTRRAYIWPASHFASRLTDERYPPMGLRFRLKADVDLSGFSPVVQVILRALKRYGTILADNGSAWFLSGVPNENWNNTVLRELRRLRGSDFEAVEQSALMNTANSSEAKQLSARVRNGASGQPAALSPRMVVTVHGDDLWLGDAEEVPLAEEWKGIEMLVGDRRAGLLAMAPAMIRAVTPDKVGELLEVRRNGQAVARETVLTAPAAPGVLPRVWNEDGSENSAENRAAKGSVVVLYGTGFSGDVEARIGGRPAEVVQAGSVDGMVKLHLRVPMDAPAGELALWMASDAYPASGLPKVSVR